MSKSTFFFLVNKDNEWADVIISPEFFHMQSFMTVTL